MICSFFSHKGGVGRTMAVANIAWLLVKKGKKVIMMDWDFESPGLECFFRLKRDKLHETPGFMDLIETFNQLNPQKSQNIRYPELKDYLYEIPDSSGRLALIHPGRRSSNENINNYVSTVSSFSYLNFYNEHHETFFDWMYHELNNIADYVLIDERTGFANTSGIGNFHMADIVLLFSSTSKQNFEGLSYMLKCLNQPELEIKRKNRKIKTLIVPSRFETSETEQLSRFSKDFYHAFEKYLVQNSNSHDVDIQPDNFMWDLGIPYVPYYSFHDIVAVKEINSDRNRLLRDAYNRLLKRIERTYHSDVIVHYCEQDKDVCEIIVDDLKKHGIKVWVDFEQQKRKKESFKSLREVLKYTRYFLLLFSKNYLNRPKNNFTSNAIECSISEASQYNQSIVLLLDDTPLSEDLQNMTVIDSVNQDKNSAIRELISNILIFSNE
jgi:MinD-like ATPase involved in chromosome partitioning or flagellar assembly